MGAAVESTDPGLAAEEARLARRAAGGDAEAFASLYERYAQRAYNLALRICGSDEDAADAVQEAFLSVMRRLPELGAERELAFGSYLFTATRNATYDLIRRQQRARPSDSIPESAVPLGAGAGGLGLDPGDPDEDPDRKVLLAAQQEEIAAANARLPERQREALALRELEEMSYDEIADVMEMNRNSVAQLISRARIGLRDELRGTALASVAVSSPDCERALPLIAARDDGQLADSAEAAWLASHMAGCHTCQVASEAMQEAGVSYRAWIPAAVAPWVFEKTMARAAELSGSDWSGAVARQRRRSPDPSRIPGMPAPYVAAAEAARDAEQGGSRRRRGALIGALALLLLLGGTVVALSSGGGEGPPPPATGSELSDAPVAAPAADPEPAPKPAPVKKKKQEKPQPTQSTAAPAEPEPLPVTEASAPAAAPPAEAKTKTASKTPPPAQPQGGEAGLDGSSARTPQPEPPPPVEPPPAAPPPGPEEPEPTPEPPPRPPGGPGDFKGPTPPGGPVP